jgi:hypothetical protein
MRAPEEARTNIGGVSQAERLPEQLVELEPAERAWLDERLQEYRELLAYLRDH